MSSNTKMTGLPAMFDASQIAPAQPFEALPPNWYNVAITDGEVKPTNDGSGLRIELEWTILDGPYKGRKVFDGFNIQNASAKAQEIAQQQFSAVCHATATIHVTDVQALYNKPHQIKLDVEGGRYVGPDKVALNPQPAPGSPPPPGCTYYEAKNRFRGAKAPGDGAATPGTTGAAAGGTPSWAVAKPAGTVATDANPFAPKGAAAPAGPVTTTGPKGPAGPKAEPAKIARKFHLFLNGAVQAPVPETEIFAMIQKGMPLDTMLAPEGGGDDSWKKASEWKIEAPAAAPAVAAAGAAVSDVPPWLRGK